MQRHAKPSSPPRRLLVSLLVVLAAAMVAAAAARAEIVVSQDNQGRRITFDVRAAGVDVEWYAALLRGAVHGDEISAVTIRIVPAEEITSACGASAAACYGRRGGAPLMIVPAGQSERVAHSLLHEYGHHIDHAWVVTGFPEPNGTSTWWAARRIEELLRGGRVAFDYSLGWDHSIGEIFAEDYAYIHLANRWGISWLSPPDEALKSTLLAELAAAPAAPPPAAPPAQPVPEPVVVVRQGSLAPRAKQSVRFMVDTNRLVTMSATVAGSRQAGTRARVEIFCGGQRVASRPLTRGLETTTLDIRGRAQAICSARVLSTSKLANSFVLRVRVAFAS
jgi:hypothetical protein